MQNDLTLTQITVHCPIDSMGDCSEADADGYRDWLTAELTREYPGADINVTDKSETYSVRASVDDEGLYLSAQESVNEFCQHAWGRCNWEWV